MDAQRDMHIDEQMDGQTDRCIDRWTDGQTDTQWWPILLAKNDFNSVISIYCCSVSVGNISLHFQTFILPLIVKIQWDFCMHKQSDNSQCSTKRSTIYWNFPCPVSCSLIDYTCRSSLMSFPVKTHFTDRSTYLACSGIATSLRSSLW